MDLEHQSINKKENINSSKKIRVYLDKEARNTFFKWYFVCKYVYNKCLWLLNNDKTFKIDRKELRKRVINNDTLQQNENTKWLLEYNYDLRDCGLETLINNYKSNIAKYKTQGKPFKIYYKKKDEFKYKPISLIVRSKYWNKSSRNFFSKLFTKEKLRTREKLPDILPHDCRLIREPTGHFYLCIPDYKEQEESQEKQEMIAFDPGLKSFLTGYDPNGSVLEIGKGVKFKIKNILFKRNKIKSLIDTCNNKKRKKSLNKALLRTNKKIRNLIDDLHKRTSKFLCHNYKNIIIPKLNFHKLKNLNKEDKEVMACLKHCSFVDRLKMKSNQYKNCRVFITEEAYTTQTCSSCGYLHKTIRNNDIFECSICNKIMGRDINASKNIFMKFYNDKIGVFLKKKA